MSVGVATPLYKAVADAPVVSNPYAGVPVVSPEQMGGWQPTVSAPASNDLPLPTGVVAPAHVQEVVLPYLGAN